MHPTIEEARVATGLVLNVPEWFANAEFSDWLNTTTNRVMTWHVIGSKPDEWSDTMVLVDGSLNGEGADKGMPDWAWDAIVDACRHHNLAQREHIPVRLTNVEVD